MLSQVQPFNIYNTTRTYYLHSDEVLFEITKKVVKQWNLKIPNTEKYKWILNVLENFRLTAFPDTQKDRI